MVDADGDAVPHEVLDGESNRDGEANRRSLVGVVVAIVRHGHRQANSTTHGETCFLTRGEHVRNADVEAHFRGGTRGVALRSAHVVDVHATTDCHAVIQPVVNREVVSPFNERTRAGAESVAEAHVAGRADGIRRCRSGDESQSERNGTDHAVLEDLHCRCPPRDLQPPEFGDGGCPFVDGASHQRREDPSAHIRPVLWVES